MKCCSEHEVIHAAKQKIRIGNRCFFILMDYNDVMQKYEIIFINRGFSLFFISLFVINDNV